MSINKSLPSPIPKDFSNLAFTNARISSCNLRFLLKSSLSPSKSSSEVNISLHPNKIPKSIRVAASSTFDNGGNSGEESLAGAEAREAVSEILQESGLSKEEAIEIACKSPKYVEALIESVRDLDELSLWKSWRIENEDVDGLSFKKKVFYMAKEKGDKGLLPFLESAGLKSSKHIARYLAAEPLPVIIHKVKYVKELLFSGSEDGDLIGKNARRMMTQLSIFVDEDVQQTLSFFQKMEAKRGGLGMLGSKDASFQYLIESFPRLLMLSVEKHLKPLVRFLEGLEIPEGQVRAVLLLFPPIFFYNIHRDIRPRIHAFKKVGAEEKDVGKMLVKYPWILSTSIQENYEEILPFFELEKVQKSSVDRAIKSWPHLLGCSIDNVKSMLEQFDELNVTTKKLSQVIASSPQLLLKKPHVFLQVVSFMEDLGLDEEDIGKVLGRCPEIFCASVDKTLRNKLKFLNDIGISENYIPRVIQKYPELLVSDINHTLLPRTQYLRKIGLSQREVAFMIHRFPPLIGYSIDEVLRPKVDFLVNTMQKPVLDIVDYPRYLSYSLDKKIKPRFFVLKARNVDCSLKEMLAKNDEEFAATYMGIGSNSSSVFASTR